MDMLTFTLLAAHHPTACVRDIDRDRWHAACLLHFIERGDTMSLYRDGISVCAPYGNRDLCFGYGSLDNRCPANNLPTMTTAPEGPWTR